MPNAGRCGGPVAPARPCGDHATASRGHQVTRPVTRPLPQPPAGAVWPSAQWTAHRIACTQGRRCHHAFAFPDWWLAMITRGKPLDPDADAARQIAVQRIGRYKGHPHMLPEPLTFTQQAVLDALCVAPAPISKSWLRASLSSVGGMARWVHATGQPLTREHVFSEEVRYRFVTNCDEEGTRRLYSARLQLIADALNGIVEPPVLPHLSKRYGMPIEPITLTQEVDLWAWSRGLRPLSQRRRVQAMIALGLGCGLTRREQHGLTTLHVTHDVNGVHISVPAISVAPARLVTCRRDWEDRLIALVADIQPGHLLLTPWMTRPPSGATLDQSLVRARRTSPPFDFNITRLRNTWLSYHLTTGTPLKVLIASAGLQEPNHLANLLHLLPDVDPSEAARLLRGGDHA